MHFLFDELPSFFCWNVGLFLFEGALYILKELALNLLKVKASLFFLSVYLLPWFEQFVFLLLWLDIPNFYFIALDFLAFVLSYLGFPHSEIIIDILLCLHLVLLLFCFLRLHL